MRGCIYRLDWDRVCCIYILRGSILLGENKVGLPTLCIFNCSLTLVRQRECFKGIEMIQFVGLAEVNTGGIVSSSRNKHLLLASHFPFLMGLNQSFYDHLLLTVFSVCVPCKSPAECLSNVA